MFPATAQTVMVDVFVGGAHDPVGGDHKFREPEAVGAIPLHATSMNGDAVPHYLTGESADGFKTGPAHAENTSQNAFVGGSFLHFPSVPCLYEELPAGGSQIRVLPEQRKKGLEIGGADGEATVQFTDKIVG